MSFDIFLLSNGEAFDRAIVEQAFGDAALYKDTDSWGFRYSDGSVSHAAIYVRTEPQIDGLSVNRPPWTVEFWEPLYSVLQATRTFLVWPALGPGPTWCVARADWREYVPEDFVESMGAPAVVASPGEIQDVIDASGA